MTEPCRSIEGPRKPCPACCGIIVTPCIWYENEHELVTQGNRMKSEGMTSKQIRYQLYRHWIRLEYGILAHNDRREIPACVEDTIKENWSNDVNDGNYICYKTAD